MPSSKSTWLLIAGSTESPKDSNGRRVNAAPKRNTSRDGNYLGGLASDMKNMEDQIISRDDQKLADSYRDMQGGSKEVVMDKISNLLSTCQRNGSRPCIYYTGHGCGPPYTGAWSFDTCFTTEDMLELLEDYRGKKPCIIVDACHSGAWATKLARVAEVSTACRAHELADDSPRGGTFTNILLGLSRRISNTMRPIFNPVISALFGGNSDQFGGGEITPTHSSEHKYPDVDNLATSMGNLYIDKISADSSLNALRKFIDDNNLKVSKQVGGHTGRKKKDMYNDIKKALRREEDDDDDEEEDEDSDCSC